MHRYFGISELLILLTCVYGIQFGAEAQAVNFYGPGESGKMDIQEQAHQQPYYLAQAMDESSLFERAKQLHREGKDHEAKQILVEMTQQDLTRYEKNDYNRIIHIEKLAEVYMALGQHAKAKELFQESFLGYEANFGKSSPQSIFTTFNLGVASINLGDYASAKRNLLLALEIQGQKKLLNDKLVEQMNHMIAVCDNNLHSASDYYAAAKQEKDLDKAIELLKLALKEESEKPNGRLVDIYTTLANNCMDSKTCDYSEAEGYVKKALEQTQKEPYTKIQLSFIYLVKATIDGRLGNFDLATTDYEKAKAFLLDDPRHLQKDVNLIDQELTKLAIRDRSENYLSFLGPEVSRWSDQTKDIIVYIEPGEKHQAWKAEYNVMLTNAFKEWQNALGNRFQVSFSTEPKVYDIKVYWRDSPKINSKLSTKGGENIQETIHLGADSFFAKNDIELALTASNGEAPPENDFYLTMLHEIGHSMGITGHSNNMNDVMCNTFEKKFKRSREWHLTERDTKTIQEVYKKKPDITNPPNYRISQFESFKSEYLKQH